MPKKPPPNGYFYFMQEFKKREEKRGRRFPNGMQDVALAASDEWKRLHQSVKDRYNQTAKDLRHTVDRASYQKSDEKRFNSQGVSFAQMKLEEQKEAERIDFENKFICNYVDTMDLHALRNKFIYLIHVNIFCKTDNDVYFPAELAIIRFNLSKGYDGAIHRYIDPGTFPTGYSFEVKDHSDRTHKLTREFVGSIGDANNQQKLFQDILHFLQEREAKGDIPPLFTMFDDVFNNTSITAARKTLKMLYESFYNYEDGWEEVFRVYPLPVLFMRLKNKCYYLKSPDVEAFPNSALAATELQNDSYNFNVKLACKFHQDEDAIPMCSKSYVIRWSYIIRDHCCDPLDISLSDHEDEIKGDNVMKQEIKLERNIKKGKCDDYDEDKYSSSSGYSFCTAKSSLPKLKQEENVGFAYPSGGAMKDEKYSYGYKNIKDEKFPHGNDVKVKPEKYDSYDHSNFKDEKFPHGSDVKDVKVKDEKHESYGDVKVKMEKPDEYSNRSSGSTSNMPTYAKMMQEMDEDTQSANSCPPTRKPPAWCTSTSSKKEVPALTNQHFPALGLGRGRHANK